MNDIRKDMLQLMLGSLALSGSTDMNRNQAFPMDDGADFAAGARWIPGSVTIARRRGERVVFHTECTQSCWYWEFPNGDRIQHYNGVSTDMMAKTPEGACARCGNIHLQGGIYLAPEVGKLKLSPHRHEFSVLHAALEGDEKALENLKTNDIESYEQILELQKTLTPEEIRNVTRSHQEDPWGTRHYFCNINCDYYTSDGKPPQPKKKKQT